MPGVPFDPTTNIIPNTDGRVLDDQSVVPGLYVAGWIKRGPTGIIGTNKKCAVGTVASLVDDYEAGLLTESDASSIDALLADRGLQTVDVAGWRAISAQEQERGAQQGRPRETVWSRQELLDIAATAHAT